MIKALVAQSGERGLSAFLPPKGTKVKVTGHSQHLNNEPTPHLPIAREWQDISFAMEDVINPSTAKPDEPLDLRIWSMHLLSRYQYQLGDTPTEFASLRSIISIKTLIDKFAADPLTAMSCINDDEPDYIAAGVGETLKEWMESMWSQSSWWEKKS